MKLKLTTIKKIAQAAVLGGVLLQASLTPVQAAENYRMSSLGPGTSPYMVLSHFANTINQNLDQYSIVVNATGTATKHSLDVAKGKTDFFMTSPALHDFMKHQSGMYAKISDATELSENLRALFMFPMGLYQCAVYEDSGMRTLKDIKGKRVFTGPPGSVARSTSEAMIRAATGYEPGDDYEVVKLGWDSAAQAFQDRNIDVYFNTTNAPSPVLSQVALTNQVRFLGIEKSAFESNPEVKALTSRPGYRMGVLPVGTYGENQANTEDVYTISVNVGLATRKDMPDDVIYQMTKTYWEHVKADIASSPWLRNIKVENAFDDLNMPVHPGAARYYREIGMTVPEVQ